MIVREQAIEAALGLLDRRPTPTARGECELARRARISQGCELSRILSLFASVR